MAEKMNVIEKMIDELCPEGVVFKALGEVCEFKYGKGNTIPTTGGEYPVYGCNGIVGTHHEFNNEDSPIIGHIGTAGIVVWGEGKHFVTYNGTICKTKYRTLLSKYIYYSLLILNLPNLTKGSQPFLSYGTIKTIKIPIPPIAIQQEIVKFLDTFTTLEAELEAELEARKKQYEYYLDELLTFGDDVEWKTIKEIFDFKNGLNKGKEFFGKGTPIVNFTDVFKNRSLTINDLKGKVEVTSKEKLLYSAQKNDVFFTRTSETQEDIGMVSALLDDVEDCVFSGFVLRARPKTDLLNPKFCSYFLTSHSARKEIIRNSTFTTRALTSGKRLSKIPVPIPPLAEQERIVTILDKFDALVNDISVGLPAELNARRKLYEYYRNKLLTFKQFPSTGGVAAKG